VTVGKSWGGSANNISAAAREVAYRCVLSDHLQDLTLHASLSDALLILDQVPAGSPLVSLRLSPPQGREQGCSTEERVAIATLITQFGSLRDLAIPSALLHRDTLGTLASLLPLQNLQLTSRPATRGMWQDALEIDRDDWRAMDGEVQGFVGLRHLFLDGTHPDQLCELDGLNNLLGAVHTLSVRETKSETMECGYEYGAAFGVLGRMCAGVRHLNLGVASLDEALLRELAQLQLSKIDLMPGHSSLDGGLQEAAREIWPEVEVTAQGDYQMGVL
jgi:hypothetical protein